MRARTLYQCCTGTRTSRKQSRRTTCRSFAPLATGSTSTAALQRLEGLLAAAGHPSLNVTHRTCCTSRVITTRTLPVCTGSCLCRAAARTQRPRRFSTRSTVGTGTAPSPTCLGSPRGMHTTTKALQGLVCTPSSAFVRCPTAWPTRRRISLACLLVAWPRRAPLQPLSQHLPRQLPHRRKLHLAMLLRLLQSPRRRRRPLPHFRPCTRGHRVRRVALQPIASNGMW
jgi:hypothetical protein